MQTVPPLSKCIRRGNRRNQHAERAIAQGLLPPPVPPPLLPLPPPRCRGLVGSTGFSDWIGCACWFYPFLRLDWLCLQLGAAVSHGRNRRPAAGSSPIAV